jgi:hypothetical protein
MKSVFISLLTGIFFQYAAAQFMPPQKMLLRDEGLSQLSYIDLKDSSANWYVPIPNGRDMQLVGNGRILIGTNNGYEERDIRDGSKRYELANFPGTISARRLRNGNTMLVGLNWQNRKGIVLVEVDAQGNIIRQLAYPGFNYVRLLRETLTGNFLITSNDTVFESNPKADIVWMAKISSQKQPHAWQPLRLSNGTTLVSGGYAGNMQLFSAEGKLVQTITGPDDVKPNFYAGYQILPNGNFLVINWQGHGPAMGEKGNQLLEYSMDGKLLWAWKQDPWHFSSLHAVIVMDNLDPRYLHVENENGILQPVK